MAEFACGMAAGMLLIGALVWWRRKSYVPNQENGISPGIRLPPQGGSSTASPKKNNRTMWS